MKATLFLLFCVGAALALEGGFMNDSEFEEEHSRLRAQWDLREVETEDQIIELYERFRRTFRADEEEPVGETASARLTTFKENIAFIKESNSRNTHFQLGITPFTDLSFDEFSKLYLSPAVDTPFFGEKVHVMGNEKLPESKDWINKIGAPRNQGHCGSCWAFATMNTLAAHTAIKTGRHHTDLSVQNILDCMQSGTAKCMGGYPPSAYQTVQKLGGVASEKDYPYVCVKGAPDGSSACAASQCQSNKNKAATVTDWVSIRSEDQLADAVANKGPVSIAMTVTKHFQHYIAGVMTHDDLCVPGGPSNHAMMIYGFNKRFSIFGGGQYWNIQNSWGRFWGELGYARIARGTNFCNVGNNGVYPVV